MADRTPRLTKTAIPYLTDVWNPITGCSPAGDGCRNCYAARLAATRLREQPKYAGLARVTTEHYPDAYHPLHGYEWTVEVRFHPDLLDAPLHALKPRVIGVCFMGDLFHEKVGLATTYAILDMVKRCSWHSFLVLTKRPERMAKMIDKWMHSGNFGICSNLILGTSVWDQASADRNIPHLLETPAACRFVSVEPMIGPVVETTGPRIAHEGWRWAWLDGVILGGESGPGARPMQPEWALRVCWDCWAAGVPFYFKQWGDWAERGCTGYDALPPGTLDAAIEMESTRQLPWGAS